MTVSAPERPTATASIAPPIFEQILADDALAMSHLRVWRAALLFLDWVEEREMPLDLLEHALGIDRANLSRLLARLVERGYLVRGARTSRTEAWRYRVPLSRLAAAPVPRHPPLPVAEEPELPGLIDSPEAPRPPRRRMVSRGL